jgi:hypothetical protein
LFRALGNAGAQYVPSQQRDGVTDLWLAPNSSLEAHEALLQREKEQNDDPGTRFHDLHPVGTHGAIRRGAGGSEDYRPLAQRGQAPAEGIRLA